MVQRYDGIDYECQCAVKVAVKKVGKTKSRRGSMISKRNSKNKGKQKYWFSDTTGSCKESGKNKLWIL